MMDSYPRGEAHSFIVRIWYEADESHAEGVTWRGSVDHVSSGRRLYFDELGAFLRFLGEQAGLQPSEVASGWGKPESD
jgi:hypothetical protein